MGGNPVRGTCRKHLKQRESTSAPMKFFFSRRSREEPRESRWLFRRSLESALPEFVFFGSAEPLDRRVSPCASRGFLRDLRERGVPRPPSSKRGIRTFSPQRRASAKFRATSADPSPAAQDDIVLLTPSVDPDAGASTWISAFAGMTSESRRYQHQMRRASRKSVV
jgi:hypothetical protein